MLNLIEHKFTQTQVRARIWQTLQWTLLDYLENHKTIWTHLQNLENWTNLIGVQRENLRKPHEGDIIFNSWNYVHESAVLRHQWNTFIMSISIIQFWAEVFKSCVFPGNVEISSLPCRNLKPVPAFGWWYFPETSYRMHPEDLHNFLVSVDRKSMKTHVHKIIDMEDMCISMSSSLHFPGMAVLRRSLSDILVGFIKGETNMSR